jgi:hypothetical protein
MDWNRVEGNWKQVKGSVKEHWGKLTDDDLDRGQARPARRASAATLRLRQGPQAQKEVNAWYDRQKW